MHVTAWEALLELGLDAYDLADMRVALIEALASSTDELLREIDRGVVAREVADARGSS